MELLIVSDPAGNRADVRQSGGYTSIPYGYGRRVIAPGESYLGVPYAVWREHLDQSVDLLPVIGEDGARRFRGDVPAVVARRVPSASTSPARILDAGFQLVRAAPVPLFLTVGAFYLPSYYLWSQGTGGSLGLAFFFVLVTSAWMAISYAVLALLLADVYHGRAPDVRGAVVRTLRRSAVVTGAGVVVSVLFVLGLIMLVVPGVIVLVRYFAVPAVAVLEDRGVGDSLHRSSRLSQGAGWTIFFSFGLLQIMEIAAGQGVQALGRLGMVPPTLVFVADWAIWTFLSVLMAAVAVALYYDLRVWKEGYDLEVSFGRGDRAGAGGS